MVNQRKNRTGSFWVMPVSSIVLLFALVFLGIIAACGGPSNSNNDTTPTPTPTPTTPTAAVPTAVPGTTTPEALSTPTAASSDVMLLYQVASMVPVPQVKVTQSGQVTVTTYGEGPVIYQLTPSGLDSLKQQVAATNFFSLDDQYITPDPPGILAEVPIETITYSEGSRTKSVKIRGSDKAPAALNQLVTTLNKLGSTPHP